jgi:hypothetical protein
MTNIGALQVGARQIAPGKGQTGDPSSRIGRAFVLLDMCELCVVNQIFSAQGQSVDRRDQGVPVWTIG